MSSLEIVEEATSTNSALASRAVALDHGYAIMALRQTAGRGQRGNTWESAPYMNVTLSLLLKPIALDVRHQFSMSEAVALGVVDTLSRYNIAATVKWPNDIYVGDRKICGILIENSLEGTQIARSIVGIGLNVNQREFVSSAPNPVSMWQLLGMDNDVTAVAQTMIDVIMNLCDARLILDSGRGELHRRYMSRMWRNDGCAYPYMDQLTGECFWGTIVDVAPTGHITLCDSSGCHRTYAFKEVQALIGGDEQKLSKKN